MAGRFVPNFLERRAGVLLTQNQRYLLQPTVLLKAPAPMGPVPQASPPDSMSSYVSANKVAPSNLGSSDRRPSPPSPRSQNVIKHVDRQDPDYQFAQDPDYQFAQNVAQLYGITEFLKKPDENDQGKKMSCPPAAGARDRLHSETGHCPEYTCIDGDKMPNDCFLLPNGGLSYPYQSEEMQRSFKFSPFLGDDEFSAGSGDDAPLQGDFATAFRDCNQNPEGSAPQGCSQNSRDKEECTSSYCCHDNHHSIDASSQKGNFLKSRCAFSAYSNKPIGPGEMKICTPQGVCTCVPVSQKEKESHQSTSQESISHLPGNFFGKAIPRAPIFRNLKQDMSYHQEKNAFLKRNQECQFIPGQLEEGKEPKYVAEKENQKIDGFTQSKKEDDENLRSEVDGNVDDTRCLCMAMEDKELGEVTQSAPPSYTSALDTHGGDILPEKEERMALNVERIIAGHRPVDLESSKAESTCSGKTQASQPCKYNIINLHDVDTGQVYQYLVPADFNPNFLTVTSDVAGLPVKDCHPEGKDLENGSQLSKQTINEAEFCKVVQGQKPNVYAARSSQNYRPVPYYIASREKGSSHSSNTLPHEDSKEQGSNESYDSSSSYTSEQRSKGEEEDDSQDMQGSQEDASLGPHNYAPSYEISRAAKPANEDLKKIRPDNEASFASSHSHTDKALTAVPSQNNLSPGKTPCEEEPRSPPEDAPKEKSVKISRGIQQTPSMLDAPQRYYAMVEKRHTVSAP